MHGGKSPQAIRAANQRILTRRVEADAKSVLAFEGIEQVEDPFEELSKLASEALAFKNALAARVNSLDRLRYSADGAGTEQLRAEVVLYERALDRTAKFLDLLVKSGFEERRIQLSEGQGRLIAGVLQRIFAQLELTARQQELVPVVVPAELRAINS